jgi:hypothetical protein
MAKICPRCRNSVDDDLTLCHNCGMKVSDFKNKVKEQKSNVQIDMKNLHNCIYCGKKKHFYSFDFCELRVWIYMLGQYVTFPICEKCDHELYLNTLGFVDPIIKLYDKYYGDWNSENLRAEIRNIGNKAYAYGNSSSAPYGGNPFRGEEFMFLIHYRVNRHNDSMGSNLESKWNDIGRWHS